MAILKKILMAIIAILLLAVVVSFFLPSKTTMQRSTVINAPANQIFDQVNNLKNWESWSPWYKMEPEAKRVYSDNTAGNGSFFTWDGEKTGKGKLSITESQPGKLIKTALHFDGQGDASSDFIFNETDKGTDVTWTFETENGFNPAARWMGLFMDKFLGPEYEKGLKSLKEVSESRKAIPQFSDVKEIEVNGITYLTVRDIVKSENIQAFYADNFQKILAAIEARNLEAGGQPRGFYYSWDQENNQTDMAAAIPVSPVSLTKEPQEKVALADNELSVYDDMVVLDHYGPYEKIELAHNAIGKWIEDKGKTHNWPVMEEYITDPGAEPDAAKWLTKIYYTY